MARTFYTERDIEDLAARGVKEVRVDDNVYITDAALEMMDKLGIKRVAANGASPSSSVLASPDAANVRQAKPASSSLSPNEKQEVIDKVKSGVIARLGPGVDSAVVDKIVRRVVGAL
jgi:hypothetical protein